MDGMNPQNTVVAVSLELHMACDCMNRALDQVSVETVAAGDVDYAADQIAKAQGYLHQAWEKLHQAALTNAIVVSAEPTNNKG